MTKFRKACRWLHRHLGFLAVGLTLVYAASGIAVNHVHHWDPDYVRSEQVWSIEPVGAEPTEEILPLVLERLALTEAIKNTWRSSPTVLQVFLEGSHLDVDLESGKVVRHEVSKRPFFFQVNFMHLNSGKAPWTGIADAYAGILILLALTGIFLLGGSKGLSGRGGILMAVGILLPVVYAFLVRG